jgi:hypothetical protein
MKNYAYVFTLAVISMAHAALAAEPAPWATKDLKAGVIGADITTGKWKDGRVGVYYSPRKDEKPPTIRIWGTEGTTEYVPDPAARTYEGLVRAIAEFFHTGRAPVDPAESLEVMEFISAAQLSHERGGAEVLLDEVRK